MLDWKRRVVIEKGRDAMVAIGGSMVLVRGAGGSFASNVRLGCAGSMSRGSAGGKMLNMFVNGPMIS